jgi:glycosyltransferase involved in cell wall biosynthesis
MTAPLISVIVPTFDGERYLEAALASVLTQPWRPLEVVVSDDGSSDGTVTMAQASGAPVRVVRQTRGGPAAARNLGLSAARGDFIAFIDQDDLWIPEKLAVQMAAFDADPALDVCVGHIQRFHDAAAGSVRVMLDDPVPAYLSITMLAKRAAFDRVGGFDTSLAFSDSADWFFRARDAGVNVLLLPNLLTLHREHDANMSLTRGDQARQEFMRLLKRKIDRERGRATVHGDSAGE